MDGSEFVVGTNFGQSHQPAWALNLLAEPRAMAEYLGETWEVHAVVVPDADRDNVWPHLYEATNAYRSYRARLARDIHMFRLDRV